MLYGAHLVPDRLKITAPVKTILAFLQHLDGSTQVPYGLRGLKFHPPNCMANWVAVRGVAGGGGGGVGGAIGWVGEGRA